MWYLTFALSATEEDSDGTWLSDVETWAKAGPQVGERLRPARRLEVINIDHEERPWRWVKIDTGPIWHRLHATLREGIVTMLLQVSPSIRMSVRGKT